MLSGDHNRLNLLTKEAGFAAIKEARRKSIRNLMITAVVILFILFALYLFGVHMQFWFLINHDEQRMRDFGRIAFLIGLGMIYTFLTAPFRSFKKAFKMEIMPFICAYFKDYHLRYLKSSGYFSPYTGGHDTFQMTAGRLYGGTDFSCSFDDIFEGTFKNVPFIIAEIKTSIKAGKNGRLTTFKGLLVSIVHHDSRISDVVVRKRGHSFWEKMERVRLEDPKFEKYFDVYGKDQILARKFLTPKVMEHILGIAMAAADVPDIKDLNKTPEFILSASGFSLFIPSSKNLFEYPGYMLKQLLPMAEMMGSVEREVTHTINLINAFEEAGIIDKFASADRTLPEPPLSSIPKPTLNPFVNIRRGLGMKEEENIANVAKASVKITFILIVVSFIVWVLITTFVHS